VKVGVTFACHPGRTAVHQGLDALCRGGSGDAQTTDDACAPRLHAEKLLGLLGLKLNKVL